MTHQHNSKQTHTFWAAICALFLTFLALSGPTWEKVPQPVYSVLQGRVIVLDLSRSMDSQDITPSRLIRARFKAIDLINAGIGLQHGLVVFAGDAFTVSPMTDDRETLINLIPSLETNTVPVQGHRSDLALTRAEELLNNAGIKQGEIILITDAISNETTDIAATIATQGHRISVLGIGTENGEPIPLPNGGLLKDNQNNIIIPKLDVESLQAVARQGNGQFTLLSNDDRDIDILTPNQRLSLSQQTENELSLSGDQWKDQGIWLLMPLCFLALLAFRKGGLFLLLIGLSMIDQSAYAFDWNDLWQRSDQQAAQAFSNQQYDQTNDDALPMWQGAGHYRSENYEDAIASYSRLETESAHFNRGNALARSGQLEDALSAYENALELNPEMEDALFNKQLVEQLLEQQEQQEQDNSSQDPPQNEKEEEPESSDGSQSDSEQQENPSESNSEEQENQEENETQQNQSSENSDDKDESENNDSKAEQEQQEASEPESESEPVSAANNPEEAELDTEEKQALEQWLNQIPDDPGGLLRRKFANQYSKKPVKPSNTQSW